MPIATVGMLPGACMAETLTIPEAAAHYVQIAKELLALYRAMGYSPEDYFAPYSQLRDLDADPFETSVEKQQEIGLDLYRRRILGRPAMHNDLRHGRRIEVEHNIGELVRMADRLQVPIPALTVSYRIIKTLESLVS